MSGAIAALHMVQLVLASRDLYALGKARRLPMRQVDVGYLVHCHLSELFGPDAISCFAVKSDAGTSTEILAYSSRSADELRQHAQSYAEPNLYAACDWERFASKIMPHRWTEGQRLGFAARICPIVRMSRDGPKHRKGAEVDAFLRRCWAEGESIPVDRAEVYAEWLREEMGRRGGAELEAAKMVRFKRSRLLRRTQGEGRVARSCERPDVRMRGVLRVTQPGEFAALLRRGLGRHRSFGFGMMLLRPERS